MNHQWLVAVVVIILVVIAVLVGRRGRVRRRHGRRDGDGHVVGEHGHELLVVQPVEAEVVGGSMMHHGGARVPAFFVQCQRGLHEGYGIARGPPVDPTPGGGEIEELVDPVTLRLRRWLDRSRSSGGGDEIGRGG